MKKIILFLLLFAVVFPGRSMAGEKKELHVGYISILPQLPIIVSYENDRFDYSTLKLRLTKYSSFTSLEAALRTEVIDAASIPLPIVLSMAADQQDGNSTPISIIGCIQMGGSVLMATKATILPELKDANIGVPGLDSSESLILKKVLDSVFLRFGLDYKAIGISFNEIIPNIKSGKLTAMYFPEPYGTIAETEEIAFPVSGQSLLSGTLSTLLVVRTELLDDQPEMMDEWIRSLISACKFIENDIISTGGKQSALIQVPFFRFSMDIVEMSLKNRKGDIRFDCYVPDKNTLKEIQNTAFQIKMLMKSIDIEQILRLGPMRKAAGLPGGTHEKKE